VRADIADRDALSRLHREHPFDAVIHMAADCLVGESMAVPADYYRRNLIASLDMAEALRRLGVRRLVFSSSAAVYGNPSEVPIPEEHPCLPTNPYGETKLAFERALGWFREAYGLASISLRYFNAAGAHAEGGIGEDHEPETHLIPCMLAVVLGRRARLEIHGDDYPTPDGTCVRDYVHVDDLAEAHVLALQSLEGGDPGASYNLGSEHGHSVQEVLAAARRVTGHAIPVAIGPRRPGDPPVLVASSHRARERLGWRPRMPEIDRILQSAWDWHQSHPHGYGDRPGAGR
jgi:UDP-glucose 4-epimerase